MKSFKSMVTYELRYSRSAIGIFFGIYCISMICLFILSKIVPTVTKVNVRGTEFIFFVFFFICGLVDFKESFHIFQQNGMPRQKMMPSFLCAILVYATVLSTLSASLDLLLCRYLNYISLYDITFHQGEVSSAFFLKIIMNTLVMVTVAGMGYLIGVTFYKNSQKGKKILVYLLIITLFILIPVLFDLLYRNDIISDLLNRAVEFFGQQVKFIFLLVSLNLLSFFTSYRLTKKVELNVK